MSEIERDSLEESHHKIVPDYRSNLKNQKKGYLSLAILPI